MKRRDFIKTTAILGAGATVPLKAKSSIEGQPGLTVTTKGDTVSISGNVSIPHNPEWVKHAEIVTEEEIVDQKVNPLTLTVISHNPLNSTYLVRFN